VEHATVADGRPNSAAVGSAALLWVAVLPPFAVGFGYGAVLPVLPGWLQALHADGVGAPVAWHAGLLSAAYVVGAMLGAPLWGAASDRIGRRPVLAAGLAGSVAGLLLLWPAMQSLPALYVARFVNGAFAAAALPVTLALAAERVPDESRARLLAWINGGAVLGFLAGPAFGGTLHALARGLGSPTASWAHGMAVPLVSSAVVVTVILALVWRALPSGRPVERTNVAMEQRGPARALMVSLMALGAFGALGLGVLEVGLAVFGLRGWELSPGRLAVFYAVCSALMLLTQLFVFARLARHVEERWIAAGALSAMAAGFALLGASVGRYSAALASVALIAGAVGLLTPALSQLAARHGGARVGTWAGWQNSAGNFGQAIGSALAGALFGWLAFRTFYAVGAVLIVAAMLAALLAAGRSSKESAG
jgi:MFS family permease